MCPSPSPGKLHIHTVTDLDLPALDVYRHLKDRHLKCRQGLFIAEGLEVVRRLLRSSFEVQSLLVTPGKLERLSGDVPPGVPVYVASVEQMESIAGFTIHRGSLACGVRPPRPSLEQAIAAAGDGRLVVVMENVADAQNVGVTVRNAAAFGADLVVLAGCADAFYRRAVRVSMGNVFVVPLYLSDDLVEDLPVLRQRLGLELVAAVLSEQATPLSEAPRPARVALLVGAEGDGLSPAVVELCDHRVVVPMRPESDSINVAVAAGIFLYAYSASSASGSTATSGSAKGDAAARA
jgi:tRNA G18 (ribose-2'-O)-methylase SpoU